MVKNLLICAAAIALSGCWHATQQAAQEPAIESERMSATQATWTQVAGRVRDVRGILAQADWDRARTELTTVYRDLYTVVVAPDLTPELRSRVTRVFPTLIALQGKVDERHADARVLADKLDDMIRDTQNYMVTSGWLRGGGAGVGQPRTRGNETREGTEEPTERRDPDRPIYDTPR